MYMYNVLEVKMLHLVWYMYLRFSGSCQQVYCRRLTITSLSLTPLVPVTCVKLAVPVGKFFSKYSQAGRVKQEESSRKYSQTGRADQLEQLSHSYDDLRGL